MTQLPEQPKREKLESASFPNKVEELALQSMISSRRGTEMLSSQCVPEQSNDMLMHVDNEASINQTELKLSTRSPMMEEEEEEEEESDS
ncbi:snRNA-activating protein complex subunit 5 isoform X2 [Nannospalax galili]|uniref:snRNA-activating protein complex subunit 5 isoform X2 n=1 Tax=Nannospalax galili TaxID=1026970 RepID=UPI000819F1D8|nr:snRNA-activating protein complex subunit 5 isoform X2 [Nannospalax galili]XP_029420870.1 snRNA-activating protein complex subunit 5 isoform X2 [Nannospalax galili]